MDPYDIATPNKPYYGMSIGPYYADEDDKDDEDLSIPEIKDISPPKQTTNLLAPILHMPIQSLTQSDRGTVRSHTPPPQSHISISSADKTNFQLLQDEFKNLLQQTQQLVGLILNTEANVNNNNTPRTSSISDLSKSISQLSIRGYSEYILDNDDLARAKEKDQSAPPSPAPHKLKLVDVPAQVKDQAAELAHQIEEIKKRTENLQEDQSRGESIDWNKSFQEVLRLPDQDPQQRLFKYDKIREIARNFERTAEMFGKIIISEIFVPKKYKTIKPVTGLGGYAGGEKYIYNGILFKFAIDWKDIYGSDEFAMKAAGHELKGLMQVFTSNVTGISVPLMTLIDYLGFRLVAESILPINRTTIVYGSADAGITVHASRDEVNERMKQLGDKLHLAGHIVGRDKTNTCLLHTAGDMEGHLGYDGEFYLVDFARLMPPTPPVRNNRTSYLYQLFRPEFVKSYKVHLCSDSFSKLDEHDPDKARHEKQLRDAFKFKVEKLIPEFVRRLDSKFCKHNDGDLVDLVHQNGINLRYLSIVRALSQNSYLKMQLLLEMCARTIKCKLWRNCARPKRRKEYLHWNLITRSC
jgi:hypothetical protein